LQGEQRPLIFDISNHSELFLKIFVSASRSYLDPQPANRYGCLRSTVGFFFFFSAFAFALIKRKRFPNTDSSVER
jgi:hypothetical protein